MSVCVYMRDREIKIEVRLGKKRWQEREGEMGKMSKYGQNK